MKAAHTSEATLRAVRATSELADLLKLAYGAAHRVRWELSGDAHQVAGRLSRHLDYLQRVAELLRHEVQRAQPGPTSAALATPELPVLKGPPA